VPANNRARGGRAGQNHLGIPFNRTASETNCGLTVCRLQPGQSEGEKGAKCRRKDRGRRAREVNSRPRLRFKWNWWITERMARGILAQRLMKLDTEPLPRNSLRRYLAQRTHLFYAAYASAFASKIIIDSESWTRYFQRLNYARCPQSIRQFEMPEMLWIKRIALNIICNLKCPFTCYYTERKHILKKQELFNIFDTGIR